MRLDWPPLATRHAGSRQTIGGSPCSLASPTEIVRSWNATEPNKGTHQGADQRRSRPPPGRGGKPAWRLNANFLRISEQAGEHRIEDAQTGRGGAQVAVVALQEAAVDEAGQAGRVDMIVEGQAAARLEP